MIKSFKHKGLKELFAEGDSRKVRQNLIRKSLRRLDALDAAQTADDLNLPGFGFHRLSGFNPTQYLVKVSANYRITFEFEEGHAFKIDLEDYH